MEPARDMWLQLPSNTCRGHSKNRRCSVASLGDTHHLRRPFPRATIHDCQKQTCNAALSPHTFPDTTYQQTLPLIMVIT